MRIASAWMRGSALGGAGGFAAEGSMGAMLSVETFDPATTIQTWASCLRVAKDDVEEAVWMVGFDEDAVRRYLATRRRVFIPDSEPVQAYRIPPDC
jgi:hypothetical protein